MADGEVQKVSFVPEDDVNWFNRAYPQRGAWSWFVRECLRLHREIYDRDPLAEVEEVARNVDMTEFAKDDVDDSDVD